MNPAATLAVEIPQPVSASAAISLCPKLKN
jgi:hypothetical protein